MSNSAVKSVLASYEKAKALNEMAGLNSSVFSNAISKSEVRNKAQEAFSQSKVISTRPPLLRKSSSQGTDLTAPASNNTSLSSKASSNGQREQEGISKTPTKKPLPVSAGGGADRRACYRRTSSVPRGLSKSEHGPLKTAKPSSSSHTRGKRVVRSASTLGKVENVFKHDSLVGGVDFETPECIRPTTAKVSNVDSELFFHNNASFRVDDGDDGDFLLPATTASTKTSRNSSSLNEAAAATPKMQKKREQQQQPLTCHDRLKLLMKKPENQVCSDCNEKRPQWASLIVAPPMSPPGTPTPSPDSMKSRHQMPIGAFCCYECSGAHRRLGTHITFVRSISLDSWKEKEVEAMENGGNAKVNAAFEAKLERSGETKPTNHANSREREAYIRDKYERRKFYDPATLVGSQNSTKTGNRSSSVVDRRNKAPPLPVPPDSLDPAIAAGETPSLDATRSSKTHQSRTGSIRQSNREGGKKIAKIRNNESKDQRREASDSGFSSSSETCSSSTSSKTPESSGSQQKHREGCGSDELSALNPSRRRSTRKGGDGYASDSKATMRSSERNSGNAGSRKSSRRAMHDDDK